MDLAKVGAFLAQLRREKGYTQEQLGEKLGVTNKTVSRWENGNYLPGAEALLALSGEYGITINEILCGERFGQAEYQQRAEETLSAIVEESAFCLEERKKFWQARWKRAHWGEMVLCSVVALATLAFAMYLEASLLVALILIVVFASVIWRHNKMMTYVEAKLFGDGT